MSRADHFPMHFVFFFFQTKSLLLLALVLGLSAYQITTVTAKRCDGDLSGLEEVCENHIPSDVCITVFGRRETRRERPERCESPYLQAEALQCARHCRICCEREEHACADTAGHKLPNGRSCAAARADGSCWKSGDGGSTASDEMIEHCAGSCGLCSRRERKWDEQRMCRDLQLECPDMADFCPIDERVRRICPLTCEKQRKTHKKLAYGTPCEEQKEMYEFKFEKPIEDEDCANTRKDCRANLALCETPTHFKKMGKECAAACAHCKPKGHKCEDRDAKKCAEWQAHKHRPFCQSHSFSKGAKFYHCAKTCKLC